MESIKLKNKYIDTSGIYDSTERKTQDEINAEKYTTPSGGIPLTDLASDVQTSLGKADTAVQGVKGDSEVNYRAGKVNITKANIGLDQVENKSAATIIGEITDQDIIAKLGYTPGTGYTEMTKLEATAGTSTAVRVISAYVLNSAIEEKGYTSNVGTITGITMNGVSKGTSGVVDLGTVLTSGFVTPEMFGAVGDGVTDDTAAVQAAINHGGFVIMTGNYKISDSANTDCGLLITGGQNVNNNLNLIHTGVITYVGTHSAIRFYNVRNITVQFGNITVLGPGTNTDYDGNCIEFYAPTYNKNGGSSNYIQYVNLEFGILRAKKYEETTVGNSTVKSGGKCVWFNIGGQYDVFSGGTFESDTAYYETRENILGELIYTKTTDTAPTSGKTYYTKSTTEIAGWINEIRIQNGRCAQGKCGIYCDANNDNCNNIKIYNTGIEPNKENDVAILGYGIYLCNNCRRWAFVNCRYAEPPRRIFFVTDGYVDEIMFEGPQYLTWTSQVDFSNETNAIFRVPIYAKANTRDKGGILKSGERVVREGKFIDKMKRGTVVLSTTWNGAGPYNQTVYVYPDPKPDSLTADKRLPISAVSRVDLYPDESVISQLVYDGVSGLYIENDNGTLKAVAVGAVPSTELTISCEINEVSP